MDALASGDIPSCPSSPIAWGDCRGGNHGLYVC